VELTAGRISGQEIQAIIDLAKEMLQAPLRRPSGKRPNQLLDQVEETLAELSAAYTLMLLTKGDLFDQETKIARSGLADYFARIEIASEKTSETYKALLTRYKIAPERFLMVGNSLKSDILPVVAVGGQAVYIPYALTWGHEMVEEAKRDQGRYVELEHISLLPALVGNLEASADL